MGCSIVEPSGTVYCGASLRRLLRRAAPVPSRCQIPLLFQEESEPVWVAYDEFIE